MGKVQLIGKLAKVAPNTKYAHQNHNTVLPIQPKGGTAVNPTTFIKVYYADHETID